MNSGTVSKRYARALFEYAKEQGVEDKVFTDMQKLSQALTNDYSLRTALDNPVLFTSDKLELTKTAAGGQVSDAFVRFIELVLHQKREKNLQTISLVYLDLYRDYKNISVGKLVTAGSIDTAAQDKIKQLVNSKVKGTLEFETQIDPEIGGGFVLYIDTYRLDASVSTQLKSIREQLLRSNKKVV